MWHPQNHQSPVDSLANKQCGCSLAKKSSSALCRCACISFLLGRKDAAAGVPVPSQTLEVRGEQDQRPAAALQTQSTRHEVPILALLQWAVVFHVWEEKIRQDISRRGGGTRNIPGNAQPAVPSL